MFISKDFKSYDQYVWDKKYPPIKSLQLSPKAAEPEKKTAPAKKEKAVKDYDESYEIFKLEWMIDNGYSIYDLLGSVVEFALSEHRTKELISDPIQVLSDWEDKSGFPDGNELYLWDTYDDWVVSQDVEETEKSDDDDDQTLSEIIDYMESGVSQEELVSLFAFSPDEVSKAAQYCKAMGMSV